MPPSSDGVRTVGRHVGRCVGRGQSWRRSGERKSGGCGVVKTKTACFLWIGIGTRRRTSARSVASCWRARDRCVLWARRMRRCSNSRSVSIANEMAIRPVDGVDRCGSYTMSHTLRMDRRKLRSESDGRAVAKKCDRSSISWLLNPESGL